VSNASGDINCNPAYVIRQNFNLAGMQSGPNLQTEVAHIVADSFRATHGTGGTIKRGKKSVSERSNFFATKSGEFATHTGVMHVHKMPPFTVAKRNRAFRRANYICEQHRRERAVRFGMRERSS
jgi:hypothetical protein